jgi:hypothetical protein
VVHVGVAGGVKRREMHDDGGYHSIN